MPRLAPIVAGFPRHVRNALPYSEPKLWRRHKGASTMRPLIVVLVLLATTYATSARDISRCLIEVDGRTWADGPCDFEPLDEGDASFEVIEKAQPQTFAYIFMAQDGDPPHGFWNGGEGATHAHDDLGELRRDGACWLNDRAKVCAWQ